MAEDLGGVRRLVADESWPPATAGLLTIRSEQMEEFIRRRALLQRERIVNYLRRVAPIETESMTEAVLHDLVLESEQTGAQLGLRSEQAHGRWAYVMVRTGGRALEQPGLRQYITDGRVSPDDKMIWLLETLAVTEARMGDAP